MNRKIKALCAGCLSLVLLLSGCGEKGTGDQNASAVNPVEDYVSHEVNATLHQVSVTESTRPFVVNGASDYKLIVADERQTKLPQTIFCVMWKGLPAVGWNTPRHPNLIQAESLLFSMMPICLKRQA